MNKINRVVVKEQAKQIIKGKIFNLFLISLIVIFLGGLSSGVPNGNTYNVVGDGFELFRHNDNESSFDNGYDFGFGNPIEDFEFDSSSDAPEITPASTVNAALRIRPTVNLTSGLTVLISVIFMPLFVTLSGMYLSLVRRSPDVPFSLGDELGGIFKSSFNETYLKKLVVMLLRDAIGILLSILFVVPGVIFYYSSYFTTQIMSDNPNLKPSEAIKLSKKMIKGNRSELFVLDLSFIPWLLLCIVSFGFASIYVIPYMMTTKALYYENFRMRALQEGRITADDFRSFEEKVTDYNKNANYNQPNNYYNTTSGADAYYYSPSQPESNQQQTDNNYPPHNNEY